MEALMSTNLGGTATDVLRSVEHGHFSSHPEHGMSVGSVSKGLRMIGRWFARLASRVAWLSGHYLAFVLAVAIVLIWAASGPAFGFSETWQLVINTGTTIVTFLMVFLVQNAQNRDAAAVHLKLDELIRSIESADNALMRAEDATDAELAVQKARYLEVSEENAELKSRLMAHEQSR